MLLNRSRGPTKLLMDARINGDGYYSGKHAMIVSSRLTIHIQCCDTYNVIDKIKQQSGWPTWTNEHGADETAIK